MNNENKNTITMDAGLVCDILFELRMKEHMLKRELSNSEAKLKVVLAEDATRADVYETIVAENEKELSELKEVMSRVEAVLSIKKN